MVKKTLNSWKLQFPNEEATSRCYRVLNRILKDTIVTRSANKVFVKCSSIRINNYVHLAAPKYGGQAKKIFETM